MSAEVLRRAAALMRERAEAATPGPWSWGKSGIFAGKYDDDVIAGGPVNCMSYCYGGSSTVVGDRYDDDAEHIASWHPAVALAVADWLDAEYVNWQWLENSLGAMSVRAMSGGTNEPSALALKVAAAYLGEQS